MKKCMLMLVVVAFVACGSDPVNQPDLVSGDVVEPVDSVQPDVGGDEGTLRDEGNPDIGVDVPVVPDTTPDTVQPPHDVVEETLVPDAVVDTPPPVCEFYADFDYKCSEFRPETCPGGMCVAEYCIGPDLDPERWDSCGDGECTECEQPCHSDCGPWDKPTGQKIYNDTEKTMTVYVHGFELYTEGQLETMTYGVDTGCKMAENLRWFGPDRPCSDQGGENSPRQYTSLEYYGQVPAPWLSDTDVAEISVHPEEGVEALFRYSLITAKFIRHKMNATGAERVNLLCHSMGCLIIMNMIEHNMEDLAADNVFVRWVTVSGALGGAREANFYDNPELQTLAAAVGLSSADFVLLQPEVIKDKALVWDHRLHECNNPLFKEMLIHHICTTDPRNVSFFNQPVLNWLIPNVPNDGVLYTPDMYFHKMAPEVQRHTPRGYSLSSSRTFLYNEHNAAKSSRAAAVLAAAGIHGKRRVVLSIDRIELKNDLEKDNAFDFSEGGFSPAEIVPEVEVRFNPYILDNYQEDLAVHQETWADRVAGFFTQEEDTVKTPDYTLFEGPVLDEMTEVWLSLRLLEADAYAAQGINEELLGIGQDTKVLATWSGQVPLVTGHTFEFANDNVAVRVKVRVIDLY